MFNILQIIILSILFLIITSMIKNGIIRIIFVLISSIYLLIEIASIEIIGTFFDYRFYYHLNIVSFEGYGFLFEINTLLYVSLFVLIGALTHVLSGNLSKLNVNNKYYVIISAMLISVLSLPGGVLNEKQKIYEVLTAKKKNFNQALVDLGVPYDEYIGPDRLVAERGKNIIVISVESLEQGYLGSKFNNITPHLRALSKNWTFYNHMPVGPGGEWTAGSLYSYQVGAPAFFKERGNAVFQKSSDVKLTGLGHVLKRAGYDSVYLAGNPEFAGVSDILEAYGIPVVSEDNTIGSYPEVANGLNDLDLFQEAKLQVERFERNKEKPFALFLSTINTHFPNGIYDKRMEEFVGKMTNNLEFSVAAVDYLINDFIDYLKDKKLLDDTVVYIFPDHLLMGSGGEVLNKLNNENRQLYVITNAEENKFTKKTNDEIYQIDLPRMIVDGAGIKTNGTFLTDFFKSKDLINFLEKNRNNITALNNASLSKRNYMNGIHISSAGNDLTISSDMDKMSIVVDGKKNQVYNFTFNQEMVLIKHSLVREGKAFSLFKYDFEPEAFHLLVMLKDGQIGKTYLGDKQAYGIFKNGENVEYTKDEILSLLGLKDAAKEKQKKSIIEASLYAKDSKRFIAHAGGKIDQHIYTNSLEAMDLSYKTGYKLFELDIIETSDNIYVAAHDWDHWSKITGYKGILPPDRKTFLRQKIYGKYTPMDISRINDWFGAHSDAILVTDKVNKPIDFSSKFIDRQRLMMELFSWDAVKQGIKAKIRSAMPTNAILYQIKDDKIKFLKNLGITEVASSRRILNGHKDLVEKIVNSGINIFAFHVNSDIGKDETYLVCNERKYFYGLYSDSWNFKDPVDCSIRFNSGN